MRTNPKDEYEFVYKINLRYQPVIVAFDIENYPAAIQNAGISPGFFDFIRACPILFRHQIVPVEQRVFGIGMSFPKFTKRSF